MEIIGDKIKVGLVQINNGFSGQNYLPYSVGVLQAYAQHHLRYPKHYEFIAPIYRRILVAEAVHQLAAADIIGFSTYVWNFRISLEIARQIKQHWPQKIIVFGGPQVPDRCDEFMSAHDFIDIACHGEGERVFLSVLENLQSEQWRNVPSLTYRGNDGRLVHTLSADRIKDLSSIPSPYLEGVFQPLMEAHPQERWIALWETNRGCPFSCTFCDWGSAVAGKVYKVNTDRLLSEVEWFADHTIEYVFCTDANFGILPRDIELATHVANIKKLRGFPHALSVQNTKNATERAYRAQTILAEAGLNKGVALSMQSTDAATLKAIKRDNISLNAYAELQRRFTRDKVETYSDLILALPGQSYDSFVDGVGQLIEGGQHNRIQFNNLSILPNAEMGDPEYQKTYGMETVVSKIINIHGTVEDEEISEEQLLVIATAAMPREQWVRTRAFCWMTAFLYFDKVLQIPLTVVRACCSVEYRDLLELFNERCADGLRIIRQAREFFRQEAQKIQDGGPEYVHSKEWLNIWWPADEYLLIQLATGDQLDVFYAESEELLKRFLKQKFIDLPSELLHDAIQLNRNLLKRPFHKDDLDFTLSYNVWQFYQSALVGESIPLEHRPCEHHVDRTSVAWQSWDDWCREVVWYGNKKGAYLYSNNAVEPQLAGHF
jgi:tRNA A37 methylthiotransferase MiaB